MKRRKLLVLIAVLGAAAAGVAWWGLWRPIDSVALTDVPALAAPLRTPEEHDALQRWPYEIDVKGGGDRGRVLVFGCRHTNDPDDAQIAALRARFREFEPTLVLVEGRLGWHFGGAASLLGRFGESGEAVALAVGAGVSFASMEPDAAAEVADAVGEFGAAKTLAFYALRVFISERDQGVLGDDLNAEFAALLRKRGKRTGLADALPDLAAFERFWQEHGTGVDWRVLPARALWRNAGDAWTQRLAERINAFRDRYFVAAMVDAVRRGERVLAVCGSSHAVLFEPALRAVFF